MLECSKCRRHVTVLLACLSTLVSCAEKVPSSVLPDKEWYPEKDGKGNAVVCADLTDGDRRVASTPTRNVVQIDRGLSLYVRNPRGLSISAAWAGIAKLTAPSMDLPTKPGSGGESAAKVDAPTLAVFRFSPRAAGSTPLLLFWDSPAGAGRSTPETGSAARRAGGTEAGTGAGGAAGSWAGAGEPAAAGTGGSGGWALDGSRDAGEGGVAQLIVEFEVEPLSWYKGQQVDRGTV